MPTRQNTELQLQSTSVGHLAKFAAGGYLYALLDAYDAPQVPGKVQELGKESAVCLFFGSAEKKYWELAPYLIQIDPPTLEWMRQTVWKSPCGVFLLSKSGLETLRTHLRRFLMVQLPDGERWFFRFYDPRILKVYLENCRPDELEIFFGPVRSFGIVDAESDQILLLHTSIEGRPITQSSSGDQSVWQIRPEQYQALDAATHKDLEDRMMRHVKRLFPQRCSSLGEDEVRRMVRHGSAKAADYRLSREADLCRFVELSFAFGRDFDRDPRYPWASEALQDSSITEPGARLAKAYENARRIILEATAAAPRRA